MRVITRRRQLLVVCALILVVGITGVALATYQHTQTSSHVASSCLLPTFDEGYVQNPGATATVLCVNTGKSATRAQIAAANYAGQCQDGGYVACYHPCYTYTPGVPYPYHPVPCPGDKASR